MPAIWNGILSTARSESLTVPELPWPIELRPHPRARAMRLRLDEAREKLLLTHPRRMSRKTALDWARGQRDWVQEQLTRLQPGEPFVPGAEIPFEGRSILLHWQPSLSRTPILSADVLACGGPQDAFAARIERFLRGEARRLLSDLTAEIARAAGVDVRSVAVGDASSRWGSCSSNGSIRYNWRLVLAPPHLLRWVVAHEVAHRRHMDHGPAFRTLEACLYGGDVPAARAELRALGPRLKRVGRRL
ncbi:M48 family metallopeptidase [Sphingomonas sp. RB56-2]|jgi:predicted metal-dependent hydrolase|uniref:M48 family metallopeptidase n=1 Tax=Sphingomonas brevis TaxID=2908206 RepID=A0ABT0SC09_9SPHN|nr:YgjP-like metallopeptidase domain-containing protein [Sphingomonas brevis]MCL6741620.1 M48 family metallopeptidase [Sphingomonas brevis]